MTDRPYANDDIEELKARYLQARALADEAKVRLKLVDDELVARYGERFVAELHSQGRDYGEATTERDGHKLRMTVEKSVHWDQEKLRTLLTELPWDVASAIITMKLSVGERTYTRMTDDNLRGRITGARTVNRKPVHIAFAE